MIAKFYDIGRLKLLQRHFATLLATKQVSLKITEPNNWMELSSDPNAYILYLCIRIYICFFGLYLHMCITLLYN